MSLPKRPSVTGAISAPVSLVAERFLASTDELVLFTWEPRVADTSSLSIAEREVLQRLADGESNAEIARARATSTRTVANQVAAILRKTGCPSRFDLIRVFAGAR